MFNNLYINVSESNLNTSLFDNFFLNDIGSVVSFSGVIRNYNMSKFVNKVFYNVFDSLFISLLERKCLFLIDKNDVKKIFIYQRSGVVYVGQINLIVAVSSFSRKNAFHVCENLVEFIKINVPIWKKEYYSDLTYLWINSF